MSASIAALPMYDWPEVRAEVDARWAAIRDRLRSRGIAAPDALVRRNGDMPAVPGGIRDGSGAVIASDPATLPPDELDFEVLWRHPQLVLAQTCWGPLETTDLARHVTVVGQPDYSGIEGGRGELYSSAIVRRRGESSEISRNLGSQHDHAPAPGSGDAILPLDRLRGKRLAFNSHDSMSGILAITRDLEALGETLDIFADRIKTGGHRLSIRAVAEGRADVATIDCLSWDLAKRFEPASRQVEVVGWTALRKGLPYITSRQTPAQDVARLKQALVAT